MHIEKNDNKYFKVIPIVLLMICLGVLVNVPTKHVDRESTSTAYETKYIDNNQLELDDQRIYTPGSNGIRIVQYDYKASVIGWLFNKDNLRIQGNTSAEITKEPIDKVIYKGTLKYQYMWCSNGVSESYTDTQFANPLTGFTSKSPDACAQNSQGHKEKLATSQGPRCIDVTSYDYNWNNDMICTKADGTRFYTSYSGAAAFLKS